LSYFKTALTNGAPISSLPKKANSIPIQDCLVGRDNNELRTAVFKKPTHTKRLLEESPYNPTSHNDTTLTRRSHGHDHDEDDHSDNFGSIPGLNHGRSRVIVTVVVMVLR